ncbi:MAG: M14 family zinc carboxypeptidase, partial [Gammaproteobacteria bacterium]|nr:M14 family zinc carboxypeptidase [Gammaproteobacteria bacterium]
MPRYIYLCCLVAALLALMPASAQKPDFKYNVVVVNAFFDDPAMVAAIAQERQPWRVDYNKNFLTIEATEADYDALLKAGFDVEIDDRLTEQHNRTYSRLPGQTRGIDGFPCYRTVSETYADATALAQSFPDLASWVDVGDSWEKQNGLGGHDLRVLILSSSATAGPKPKLFAMSAVHAREYTTAELNTRFAEYLLDNYGTDPDVTWLLDDHEIHLSLQSNPDGRVQAQSGLFWRKNTNQNVCGATSSNRGVDLNRNFPFQWGCCGGSSGNQCSETYRGVSAASEPETQAIQDYVRSIFPDQRDDDLLAAAPADATGVFLDIHSSGQLMLWPWGWGATVAPNGTALQTFGRKMSWFNDYYPEQAIGLYPTDGTTDDFAYGELGVAAYTYELGTSFFQDCGSFENTVLPDNLQSLLYAAKVSRTPFLTPAGPDALAVNLSSGVVAPATVITLDAIADDTRFSSANGAEPVQSIAAAEYYIDLPPWSGAAATANPMTASDGAYNADSEAVTATVDTTGLAQGRHTLFVRAQDTSGNWGPVSAAFLYIVDPATAPTVAGNVTAADTGQPLAAGISAGAPFDTNTAGDGSYSLLLVSGNYDITATPDSPDYASATVSDIVAIDEQTTIQNFVLYPYCDVFSDDVENGPQSWVIQAPWAITTETANSPTHSWTDSPGSNYADEISSALTSAEFDIAGLSGLLLEFASLCDTEADYDYCIVEANIDDSGWNEVARYDGPATGWQDIAIELPQQPGSSTMRIRFR